MRYIKLLCVILFIMASSLIVGICYAAGQNAAKVKTVKLDNGAWQLVVNGKPYFIKGVLYTPVKIGEDPSQMSMRDWMNYDDNKDGINDVAYQTWVDENRNNKQDATEKRVGDFQLLKEMGCNTIRLYHVAADSPTIGRIYKGNPSTALQFDHPLNKELLRKLYNDYGIMVIIGNFLGSWTVGSGASWEDGTDYNNPVHRESIKKSVRAMVLDSKDEPYTLMWLLGNENNIASWSHCNAGGEPKAYATLIGELAEMIHKLDKNHPVAVCDGDNFNTLRQYAEHAKYIDIVAYNSYRGKYGFSSLWKGAKDILDRPIFISEFGTPAYNINRGEDEDWQLEYIKGCWEDIVLNSAGKYNPKGKSVGNSIGGVVFDWIDRWYMDGTPYDHNKGTRPGNAADSILHEEWFGIVSMGDGSDTLMRQKRKVYEYLKDVWNK